MHVAANHKPVRIRTISRDVSIKVFIEGAEEASQEQSLVGELSKLRDVRSAHPGTAPGGKKKNGGNLKESSKKKKAGKKRKNSRKGVKKGKENQKRRNKNKGKSPKKKRKGKMGKKKNKGKGKKTSRKNKGKAAKKTKNKDRKEKRKKKKAKKEKKRARKERKGKKKKKKEGSKRGRNKHNTTHSNSTSCMSPACLTNINKYMQQVRKLVKNFERQHKRILRNKNQTAGKAGKKSEFAPYIIKLKEIGGGNASSLTCHGEATGAANLKKLYDNLTNCEGAIQNACNATIPSFNHTHETHVACITLMEEFGTKVEAAYKATESADKTPEQADDIKACQTWESAGYEWDDRAT